MRTGSEYKWSGLQAILKYFELFMAVVYLSLGVTVLWKAQELFYIPNNYSVPLGGALVAYGFFRGYRVVQRYF